MSKRIKILYIAGWGRSGSTILGNILGQSSNCHFIGEAQYYWQRGIIDNQECGCGNVFNKCSTWKEITDEVFRLGTVDPEKVAFISEREE